MNKPDNTALVNNTEFDLAAASLSYQAYLAENGDQCLDVICKTLEDELYIAEHSWVITADEEKETARQAAINRFALALSALSLTEEIEPCDNGFGIYQCWQINHKNQIMIDLMDNISNRTQLFKSDYLESLHYDDAGRIQLYKSVVDCLSTNNRTIASVMTQGAKDEVCILLSLASIFGNVELFNAMLIELPKDRAKDLIDNDVLQIAICGGEVEIIRRILESNILTIDAIQLLALMVSVGHALNYDVSDFLWSKIKGATEESEDKMCQTLCDIMKGRHYGLRIRSMVSNPIACRFLLSLFPTDHEGYELLKNEIIDTFNTANLRRPGMTHSQKERYIYCVMKYIVQEMPEFLSERMITSLIFGYESGFFTHNFGNMASVDVIISDLLNVAPEKIVAEILRANGYMFIQLADDRESLLQVFPKQEMLHLIYTYFYTSNNRQAQDDRMTDRMGRLNESEEDLALFCKTVEAHPEYDFGLKSALKLLVYADLFNKDNVKLLTDNLDYIWTITAAMRSLMDVDLFDQARFSKICESPIVALFYAESIGGTEHANPGAKNFVQIRKVARCLFSATPETKTEGCPSTSIHDLPSALKAYITLLSVDNDALEPEVQAHIAQSFAPTASQFRA